MVKKSLYPQFYYIILKEVQTKNYIKRNTKSSTDSKQYCVLYGNKIENHILSWK